MRDLLSNRFKNAAKAFPGLVPVCLLCLLVDAASVLWLGTISLVAAVITAIPVAALLICVLFVFSADQSPISFVKRLQAWALASFVVAVSVLLFGSVFLGAGRTSLPRFVGRVFGIAPSPRVESQLCGGKSYTLADLAPSLLQTPPDISAKRRVSEWLKDKGVLRVCNSSTLYVGGIGKGVNVSISLNKLELEAGSTIVTNGNDLSIYVNQLDSQGGTIVSFIGNDRSAADGGLGSAGASGQSGGKLTLLIADDFFGELNVALPGQNGGRGGMGSVGTAGIQGRRGDDGRDAFPLGCASGGGNGGVGGQGGVGGNGMPGGDAGSGGILKVIATGDDILQRIKHTNRSFQPGDPGLGGPGGPGGVGGPGGQGGSGSVFCGGGHNGPDGPKGPPGLDLKEFGRAATAGRIDFGLLK